MRKSIILSLLLSVLIIFSGCGSSNETSEIEKQSESENSAILDTEILTEKIAETPTEEVTEPEVEQKELEEDENIISMLTYGYSYEGMGVPTVEYNPQTNTYVVIAPTSTDEVGNDFDSINGGAEWEQYVKKFSDLTETIIKTALITKDNKDINFRITHTLKTPTPLIVYENDDVIFDLYNSEEDEIAFYILQTQCDLYLLNSFDDIKISYDKFNNNYTVDFYLDNNVDEFINNEKFTSSFIETNSSFKIMINEYNDPNLIFNIYNFEENGNVLYTVENGCVTYNSLN